jgi:hypothetical protein
VKKIGKSSKLFGKISRYSVKILFSFLRSYIKYAPKKLCFGDISLDLRPFSYINFPMGDEKAISKVTIYCNGTTKMFSPFLMSLDA